MNNTQVRNLDLDSTYYGKDASVKRELEKHYPEFDIDMTPGDVVYTRGETVNVHILLRNFKCDRRLIDPDEVRINGEVADYVNGVVNVEEEITTSKMYDVEVTYKGKTSIRTRIIYVIYPIRAKFMYADTSEHAQFDWDGALDLLPVENRVIRQIMECEATAPNTAKYLWIEVPTKSHNLVSVRAIGLVGDLKLIDKGVDGEYHYYRSEDQLNPGVWNFLFNIEADIEFGYNQYVTYDGLMFMTSDNKYYNCIK